MSHADDEPILLPLPPFKIQLPIVQHSAASPCETCHGGCCRKYSVPLMPQDMQRIRHDLGIGFDEFVCCWEDPDHGLANGLMPHFYFTDSPAMPFVLGMRAVKSQQFPGSQMCRFLEETGDISAGGTARCSIYESRPMACRVFPFHSSDAGSTEIHPDFQNRDGWDGDPYSLCSSPWSATAEQLQYAQRNIRELNSQREFLRLLADAWNANPGPWRLFPVFLDAIENEFANSRAA